MIGIISVTEKGDVLAERIQENLGGVLYRKSDLKDFSLKKVTKEAFEKHKYLIYISSTGIAVRAISNFLQGKDIDPAVVVVDVCNKFSISLVSGHLGGANKLTLKVSEILNNTPVITTATDSLNIEAPDIIALENNLIIDDFKKAKIIASKLVNGKKVYFKDDKNLINCPRGYECTNKIVEDSVLITNKTINEESVLRLIRKDIVLGIGCRRNTNSKDLYNFVLEELEKNNIDIRSVKLISTIDIKYDEKAILDLANKLNANIRLFSKEEIMAIDYKYDGSKFVKKSVGVASVCEPVVELSNGKIIIGKIKKSGMTLCIGELK